MTKRQVWCGTNPWTSCSGPSSYFFFATTAYHHLNIAADIKNHWSSYFWYAHTDYPLQLNIQDFSPSGGANGYFTSFDRRITLWQSQSPCVPPATCSEGAEHLGVVMHEYGHYIHYAYGFDGTIDLKEGWAEHNALRYAIYRRFIPVDWLGLAYTSNIRKLYPHRHQEKALRGEYVNDASVEANAVDADLYWPPNATCNTGTPDEYLCGNILSYVYWDLAWDRCRLPFSACTLSQDIVQTGPYASSAWELVNSAYAYAIWMAGSGTNTEGFFDLISDRYSQFVGSSYLNWDDYARVASTMSHHCVGWSEHCSNPTGTYGFRLPGSSLPSYDTHKYLYSEAENGIVPGEFSITTDCNQAANCEYINVNTQNGAYATYSFDVPSSGSYALWVVSKKAASTNVTAQFRRVGVGTFTSASFSPSVAWEWRNLGTISFPSAGVHSVDLRSSSGTFYLDALRIEGP